MLKEYSIEGKVAVVTGAARGIGKGIALTLAEAGADIVAGDRNTKENELSQTLKKKYLLIPINKKKRSGKSTINTNKPVPMKRAEF